MDTVTDASLVSLTEETESLSDITLLAFIGVGVAGFVVLERRRNRGPLLTRPPLRGPRRLIVDHTRTDGLNTIGNSPDGSVEHRDGDALAIDTATMDQAFVTTNRNDWMSAEEDILERLPDSRRQRPSLSLAWLVACALLGLSSVWPVGATRSLAVYSPALANSRNVTSDPIPATTRKIRDITTGTRVLADNPEINEQDAQETQIDPMIWRNVRLRMKKPDGGELRITLLRSLTWLTDHGADAGRTIRLVFPELGIQGPAEVLAVDACPQIEDGPGRVVTGTFQHSAANVIDLFVSCEDQPIGTTANHPFWSETRQEFVQAGLLQPGEELRTATGKQAFVTKIVPRSESEAVFNLEVDAQHVYVVASQGILVHNSQGYVDPTDGISSKAVEQGRDRLGRFLPRNGGDVIPGSIAEHEVWDAIKKKDGWRVIDEHVTVRDSTGQIRVYDGVAISPNDRVIALEVKSGSARKTAAQRAFDSRVNNGAPVLGVGANEGLLIERVLEVRK